MGFASEFIGYGVKYLSFKVGNERMMTKRKEKYKVKVTESSDVVKHREDNLDIPFSYIPFMLFFVAVDFAREMDRKQFGTICNLL